MALIFNVPLQNSGKLGTSQNLFGFWHSLGTFQNAGKLGTSLNPFGFWHCIIFNFSGSMESSRNFRELPITSGNLLGNFPKCWQVRNFPNCLRIWTWHYFSASLGQWEVPGTSENFFWNFPNCRLVGNFQKSLRILTWHYFSTFLDPWEVPGTSGNFQ